MEETEFPEYVYMEQRLLTNHIRLWHEWEIDFIVSSYWDYGLSVVTINPPLTPGSMYFYYSVLAIYVSEDLVSYL